MNHPSDRVVVNQSYLGQRLTGQQRYAREISQRLLEHPSFDSAKPGPRTSGSTLATWAWVQSALPLHARESVLLSLTSRAPLYHPRHVVVVHDLFVLTNPEWFSTSYHRTHAPLLRQQLRRASAVVAVSDTTADDVSGMYSGRIVVAPNAPSHDFLLGSPASEPSVLPRGAQAGRYLLAVGSQEPRKNLARLAQAYALLSADERREHPLVVVGAGNSIYQDEQISWPEGTLVLGYVSDTELASLYAHAAAVVMVSLAEGFGLPLVEALAAGTTQLVVSDIPVFRWITGGQAHHVDPYDVASIADGLRRSVDHPTHHSVDISRFTWDTSADAVRDLCLELL